jgi:uncharacterized protein YdhG (YjbR/CyaY superfamily)
MAKAHFKSVDDYLAAQPAVAQTALKRVRSTISKALPKAEEVISYNIPAYKQNGRVVLYFAGWKHHYSLYPVNDLLVAAFEDELAAYKISKGTIRFPLSQPVPAKLITSIAKFRSKQITYRQKAKPSAPKKNKR